MSWFNLNDSLNNIKGQITSFANDVLTDETGIYIHYFFLITHTRKCTQCLKSTSKVSSVAFRCFTELKAAQDRIKQLEELCAAQQVEVSFLCGNCRFVVVKCVVLR